MKAMKSKYSCFKRYNKHCTRNEAKFDRNRNSSRNMISGATTWNLLNSIFINIRSYYTVIIKLLWALVIPFQYYQRIRLTILCRH